MNNSPNLRSEADPSVLAKYVIALLKKDESFNEETFVEQLEVFLDKGLYYVRILCTMSIFLTCYISKLLTLSSINNVTVKFDNRKAIVTSNGMGCND